MGNFLRSNTSDGHDDDEIERLRHSVEEKDQLISQLEQEINSAKYDGEQQRIALEQKLNEVHESYEHKVNSVRQESRAIQEECEHSKNRVASLEQQNNDIHEKYEQLRVYVEDLEREKEETENRCKISIDHLKEKLAESQNTQEGVVSQQSMLIQQLQVEKDEQKKLVSQLSVRNEDHLSQITRLEREVHQKSDELLQEQESMKAEKATLLSVTSASHQARKMYGDTKPGDITHSNVADMYLEFFKYYLRNLPRQNSSVDRLLVQQTLAKLFQVLDMLQSELSEMLVLQDSDDDTERDRDIASAFSLLMYHIKNREDCIEHLKTSMREGIQDALTSDIVVSDELLDKAINIVINMLTLTPPQLMGMPKDFSEEFHEIRSNNWTDCEDGTYDLVYFRPVMFHGRNGAVAVEGSVGNRPHNTE